MNINPAYRVNELKYCLDLVGCHTIIASQQLKSSNYYEMLQTLMPELSSVSSTQQLQIKE